MHPHVVRQLLTQQPDGDLGDGERVRGVDPAVGVGRGVRSLAVVLNMAVRHGIWFGAGDVHRARMHHRRGVDAREGAPVEQLDLAATTLFGGGTEHRQRDAEVVDVRRERQRGARRDRRDEVVAARVSHAGQGVVFGAYGQVQWAGSAAGDEGGLQPGEPLHHGESGVGELTGDPGARSHLLPGELGMGMQVVRQRQHLLGDAVTRGPDGVVEWGAHRSPGTPYDGAAVGSSPRVR